MDFYLDESGSSGDIAKPGPLLAFGGQPIFTLAAVGGIDQDSLGSELRRLSLRHGLLGGEVRSTSLSTIPEFAGDLATWLDEAGAPVFIEMMQKRFVIVINLVNCLLLPPIEENSEAEQDLAVRRLLVELLSETLPDDVLLGYAHACDTRRRADLEATLTSLESWALKSYSSESTEVLTNLIADATAELAKINDPLGHVRLLPLPDTSVTGRSMAMLPGLTALTNVYARINRFREGRLADVSLIHDEHMLYGDVLVEAKALMEKLSQDGFLPDLPDADYRLSEKARLTFTTSQNPGVQAADVLAGFVMRFFRDTMLGRPRSPAARMTMWKVSRLSDRHGACGINMVAPNTLIAAAGFVSGGPVLLAGL